MKVADYETTTIQDVLCEGKTTAAEQKLQSFKSGFLGVSGYFCLNITLLQDDMNICNYDEYVTIWLCAKQGIIVRIMIQDCFYVVVNIE